MRTLLSVLLLFVFSIPTVDAQTWTYTTATGSQSDVSGIRVGSTLVLDKPQENALSTWQTLPFSWTFGGDEVTGYYVSENGYITFDAAAAVSHAQNESDPLRNAICGFWDDLHLQGGTPIWSNQVYSKTTGSVPDRRHVVMWAGAVPASVSWEVSNISFAIVLYEQGGFEIVLVAGKTPRPLSGSIGAVNADGSAEAWVAGSPRLDYPEVTADPDDDLRYLFSWTDAGLDLLLTTVDLPAAVRVGQPVTISGTITNAGATEVTSCRVRYTIDDGPMLDMEAEGLALPSSAAWHFDHVIAWTPSVAGRVHSVHVVVDSINSGMEDEVPENNTKTVTTVVQRGTGATKRVLVEEFTGAWCGWCPDGGLQIERLREQYPTAVTVALHAGGTDAMETPVSAELAEVFRPSYPTAMIDRVQFDGQTGVPIQRTGDAWMQRTGERMQDFTPCDVHVTAGWNSTSDEGFARVRVRFSDFAPEDFYRVHCWLVKPVMSGDGRGWDQSNSYSGHPNYPTHPCHDLPNPIVGYEHHHVQQLSLTGTWGILGVVPNLPQADQEYERRFEFDAADFPTGVEAEGEWRVVAFVTRHHGASSERVVLNATETGLLAVNVQEMPTTDFRIDGIYPQPLRGQAGLRLQLDRSAHLRITAVDMLGRETSLSEADAAAGMVTMALDTQALRPGSYLLRVTDGQRQLTHAVVIME